MSHDITKEVNLQNDIIAQMVEKGWIVGKGDAYDRERALYAQDTLNFVQTTQPQEWEKFSRVYPNDTERHFLDALVAQLKKPTATQPISSRAPGYARRTSSRPENPQCPFFAVSV